jgi:hypothetical protein
MLIEFSKNTQIHILWKSVGGIRVVPCGEEDGRTGGQRDMTNVMVPFRNLANAPKNDTPLTL